jgi:Uma2 family endonuclease
MVNNAMAAEKYTLHSVAEYLEEEQRSEVRHEYLNGTLHAMAGSSRRHNEICGQIYELLRSRLRGGPCRTYLADVKVRIRAMAGDLFYYPDVMLGCDPTDRHDYYLERPWILFEVTSPSTELTDRREKLLAYQNLPSLGHYVIVSQDVPHIEWFQRTDAGWERLILTAHEDRMDFASIGASLSLGEIYGSVD